MSDADALDLEEGPEFEPDESAQAARERDEACEVGYLRWLERGTGP